MSTAEVQDGIELEYETFGDAAGDPLLLVMGLGAQMVAWDAAFCQRFADEGFFVVRYDNRDVGRSTKIESDEPLDVPGALVAAFTGGEVKAPYLVQDMADDAFGLLDALGIGSAHVVGASMGGMIVQAMAISRPERLRSVTSIMSTTGDPAVGGASEEAMALLVRPPAQSREQYLEATVAAEQLLNGPTIPFDAERSRRRAEVQWDRGYYPVGVGRQLIAILASGDRTEGLGSVAVPFLVIHGDADPLVGYTGGEATAKAVPGAELMTIEGMGHNLPVPAWDEIVPAVIAHARKAA
ncbi:MAG TPA: alpha/beta hydrolase [Acidimicrobiales bacterium]|nr:alpha/beta hydrolase [Acidimicrobiales bacterium]